MEFGGITGVGLAILIGVTLGALINGWIAVVTARRDVPVAHVYRWLVLATAMLCVASFVTYLAPGLPVAFAAHVFYNGFNVAGAALFVLFAIVYTGNRDWLTRRRVALFAVEPAAYVLLLATNPLHGLLLTDVHTAQFAGLTTLHSSATVVTAGHILYTMALTTAGYVLLARFYFGTRNVYRTQTGMIFLGSLGIPIGAFLHSAGVTPIDLTPFALVINGVVVWVALFRYDFLDVTPLAADLLIERMEDAVIVTGPAGEVLDANEAAERLFASSAAPASEGTLIGRPLRSVSPSLAGTMESGDVVDFPADGGPDSRTFDPSVTSIHDQYGIRRGTLFVLRDVTEQVRRQAELERQNERLDEFASVVSHDLRNPLAIAEGYVDLAIEEGDTAHLDRAASALDRMNALVDDLLTLAHDGRAVDEVERVSLASVVDAAWKNVGGDATLVNEAEGAVQADARRLQQLLENLFRNAVEHGGPGVTIRVGRGGDDFYVEDDGPGVPAEDRERVFEHGYSTSPSGTGFGLAIVRTIAEAHDWSVRLVEGRDGGARFEFSGVAPSHTTVTR